MLRQIISIITLYALVNLEFSCVARQNEVRTEADEIVSIDKSQFHNGSDRVKGLILASVKNIDFNEDGGVYDDKKRVFTGITKDGTKTEIKMEDVLYIKVVRTDITSGSNSTALIIILGIIIVMLVIAAESAGKAAVEGAVDSVLK